MRQLTGTLWTRSFAKIPDISCDNAMHEAENATVKEGISSEILLLRRSNWKSVMFVLFSHTRVKEAIEIRELTLFQNIITAAIKRRNGKILLFVMLKYLQVRKRYFSPFERLVTWRAYNMRSIARQPTRYKFALDSVLAFVRFDEGLGANSDFFR